MTISALCWGGPLEGQMFTSGSNKLVTLKPRPLVQVTLREELPPFGPTEEYEYYVRERFWTRLPSPRRTLYGLLDADWLRKSLQWRDSDMTTFHSYRVPESFEEIFYMVINAWLYEPEREEQKQRIEAGNRLVYWLCGVLSR